MLPMALALLADRRRIKLRELETSTAPPLPCSARRARGPPPSLGIQKTLEPCMVRNLEMDQDQSGTDQPSPVAEAKSQSRFDGVEDTKKEMSRKVRARQVPLRVWYARSPPPLFRVSQRLPVFFVCNGAIYPFLCDLS
ncbi:hypothetical protein LZ31DRAFT_94192 [Colletotrichum somersetense]|nr:hypothetical protein LZ31DRAFT_94192 [Colletotrichum somersetense]